MKKKLFIIASLSIIVLIAFFTLVNIMFKTNKLLMENMEALADDPVCGWIDDGGPITLADCYDSGVTVSSNGNYRCDTGTGSNTAYKCIGSIQPVPSANKYKCYKP